MIIGRFGAALGSMLLVCLFALAAGVSVAGAQPQPQPLLPEVSNEARAREWLQDPDPQRRAAAVLWMGEHRGEGDAPLVAPRLHDEHPIVRAIAEHAIWQMWSRSGDDAVDALLQQGVASMNAGDLQEAISVFDEVIRRRPGFAEGWNKRATALFLAGEYQRSLADCDEVLRRNPLHFGVLSGYGQIYLRLGEHDRALEYFRRALAVNPNMQGVRVNIDALEALIEKRRLRTI